MVLSEIAGVDDQSLPVRLACQCRCLENCLQWRIGELDFILIYRL